MKINLIILLLATCLFFCEKPKKVMTTSKTINPYEIGKTYVFRYNFLSENKKEYGFLFDTNSNAIDKKKNWIYTDIKNDAGIDKISFTVLEGLRNKNQMPIMYKFLSGNEVLAESVTGLIQNKSQIWMHPPRTQAFRILELNPFPDIKFPLEEKTTWTDSLLVGDQWGDSRWVEWEGNIKLNTKYVNNGIKNIHTSFGGLDCYEVLGVSTSSLGETKTLSYFNKKRGFVKFIFTNIDNSILTLELTDITD